MSRVLLVVLVLLTAAGCSQEGKRDRHLQRARQYLQKDQLVKAEIEFLNAARLQKQEDPEILKQLGLIYYVQGQSLKAFAFLKRAQELSPDDIETRAKLGLLLMSERRLKEARQHSDFILATQPSHSDALWILADSTSTPEEIKEAQQRLEQLRPKVENSPAFWVAHGRVAQRQRNFAAAETSIRKAIELDPKFSLAHIVLGGLYLRQSNSAMAEQEFKAAADAAPLRSLPRLQYADYKSQIGDVEGSKAILQDLARKVPDWMPISIRLAQIALAQTNYTEAESVINTVLAQDPYHLEGQAISARINLLRGRHQEALAQLQRLMPAYEKSPYVHYLIAMAQLANQDVNKAVASLNQALALAPNYGDAVMLLAELLMRRGDVPEAVILLTSFAQQQPGNLPAHTLLATAYLAQNEPGQALALYSQIAERRPDNPRIHWLTGMAFLRQTNNAAARSAFERALEHSSGYPPALNQLVELDIAEGRHGNAIEFLNKELARDPQRPDILLLLAKVHSSQTNKQLAEAALLKAIEISPSLPAPYVQLAILYVGSGREKDAIAKLETLLARTNLVAVHMQIGTIHERIGNFTAAREVYEKILATNPKFGPALNNLAVIYSERLGQLKEAHKFAQAAREALPQEPYTADTLGWILYRQGDYSKALALIQESASKLPDEPEVQFHLGMTHYALGEEAPARAALQRAIKPAGETAFKAEAGRRLALLEVDPKTAGPEVIADFEKRRIQEPTDLIVLSRLAAIYELQGSVDKLVAVCQAALSQNSRNPAFMMRLAGVYAGPLKDLPKALELAKDARNLAPDDPAVAQLLGRLNLQSGDYKWASSLLAEAARKLSPDPELLFDLAWSQYNIGRVEEAESTMHEAVQLKVPFPRIEQAKRFLALVGAHKSPVAPLALRAEAQKILESEPDYIPALMLQAASLEKGDDYLEAGRIYDRIVARNPLFVPAIRQLAILHGNRMSDDPKAYDLAVRAREAFPNDAEVAKALGLLVFQRGDYRRSTQLLKESSLKRSDDPDLLYHLGMAHYRLKENDPSKEALQRALALNVQTRFADEARRVIAELSPN